MAPLVKNSCETLVERLGEYAESGKSVDVFRYVYALWFFRPTTMYCFLIHTHIHTYIYTYIYTHTYTHTHTHELMHICMHAASINLSPWKPFWLLLSAVWWTSNEGKLISSLMLV